MHAIETRYQGVRFRSRTEARWAVFFDALGLPWEYEKEGYALPSGMYLPDFWLPTLECFVEVKGQEPTPDEVQKAIELTSGVKKPLLFAYRGHRTFFQGGSVSFPAPLLLIAGKAHEMWTLPDSCKKSCLYLWDAPFVGVPGMYAHWPSFLEELRPDLKYPPIDCEERRKLYVYVDREYYQNKYGKEHPMYTRGRSEEVSFIAEDRVRIADSWESEQNIGSRVIKAHQAALSARFEHGETPGF